MVNKIIIFILFLVFGSYLYAQTEFYQEIKQGKFERISKNKLPFFVIELLGQSNYKFIGTKMSQTGCVGRKSIVIDWAVATQNEFYVIKTATCGAFSELIYYVISNRQRYKIEFKKNCKRFKEFRNEYLKG